jgi:thymidylate synthase
MNVTADTLDDLLLKVFKKILQKGVRVKASKGANTELAGILLELKNPRARLSRTETKGTLFSCLGESLWYLSKSNRLDYIEYYLSNYGKYSDDKRTVHGAYGPRMFAMRGSINQINNILSLLRKKPTSRQAVIQLFSAEDLIKEYKDVPCTCTIQFLIRSGQLDAITHMRSNDAFLGLPHDVFAFTFLQEIFSKCLKVRLGTYKHAVGSLHIYDSDRPKVRRFIGEGYQSRISMPEMPEGNPWPNIGKLINVEAQFRKGKTPSIERLSLPNYWSDLARLLEIFARTKTRKSIKVNPVKMTTTVYTAYIDKRIAQKANKAAA